MKKFYLILLLCASFVLSKAVPAYPGLITVTQSDGTTISYYLHGDEYFSYATSEDGYLIAANDEGVMEYAYFTDNYSVKLYGMSAHNVLDRSVNEQNFVASLAKPAISGKTLKGICQQRKPASATGVMSSFPLTGSPRGLIILVSYSDVTFSTPKANFENLANQYNYSANGGTGSIKDYFIECSNGVFSPQFDVYGPYTLENTQAYYGAHSSTGDHDVRAKEMIIDACVAADGDVNFADYDTDNDGFVDNIFVYYAGLNEADGGGENTIWPHRSTVAYSYPPVLDGKNLADYACSSEYQGSAGSRMCGIGTFCHEFGHVLGLPDFYDTQYSGGLSAMGQWDIMTNGSRNNDEATPPTYTAYERFYLGWLAPTPLVDDTTVACEGTYELKSLISSNTAYLVSKTTHNLYGAGPSPKEFFMLEYRKPEGRDTYSGVKQGLLITHINYNSQKWQANGPNNDINCLGYYPVLPNTKQAYFSKNDLYPYVADHCEFTLHGEEESLLRRLTNITDNDTACAFDYARPNETLTLTVKDVEAYCDTAVTQFVVLGVGLNENLSVSIRDNQDFAMRLHTADGSGSFSKTMTLRPDSTGVVRDTLDIRYIPSKITYDEYKDNRFTVKGQSSPSLSKFAKFNYRNRRPIYISTPEAYEPADLTANSATLRWSFVADTTAGTSNIEKYGAKYYLDVYSIDSTTQVETEDFENFPTLKDDWSANFTTSSTAVRKSGTRSAVFSTAQDTLYTKEYISDIQSCAFWISSLASEGTFVVEVEDYYTGVWKQLKSYKIESTTVKDENLTMKAGFRRLRFYFIPAVTGASLAIDDVSVQCGMSISYFKKNEYLKDTTFAIKNLVAGKEYRYKVRATDRDEAYKTPRYDNVTEFSNEVIFKANGNTPPVVEDAEMSISVVRIEGTNYYYAYISELQEDSKLFIYNINGQLVEKLPVETNIVDLPVLPAGVYIVKYAKDDKKSKNGPSVKFYYAEYYK